LHGSGEYGITVGSGATDTHIYSDAIFRGNTLGDILDNGTNTLDERGKIWDVQTSDHTTAGTFGELVGKKVLTVAKFLGLK